jgi:DNA-binding beta-propeller fold protein YncE
MRRRMVLRALGGIAVGTLLAASAALAQPAPIVIPIPGGEKGVGFDDLRYSSTLKRVVVPGANTGSIVLVRPGSWTLTQIGSLGEAKEYGGGHDDGITSADEGRGFLFAADRTSQRLLVVDPKDARVVSGSRLAGGPDYVRWIEPTGEVWVTEPDKDRIEVFRLDGNPPRPVHVDFVEVSGGPESLVVDVARSRAYANLWKGKTVAIGLKNRSVVGEWPNGCQGSRGLALDEERGFVFVGCAEGAGVVLDVRGGRLLSRLATGNGIDIIDYSPSLGHLYLPGGKSGTLGIAEVGSTGALTLLAEVPIPTGSHCVAADASGHAYVCDPKGGRILVVPDGP